MNFVNNTVSGALMYKILLKLRKLYYIIDKHMVKLDLQNFMFKL